MCHDHKLKTVGFSPREIFFCSPCKPSSFHSGVHVPTHPEVSPGEASCSLICHPSCLLISSVPQLHHQPCSTNSPMPCASVKRQTWTMGKKLLLSFSCPFWQLVAFPPCPLESPDHSCFGADNSVHQQHLLPQAPPSVLGLCSRNFLHHILPPRNAMVGVSAGQWAHSAYQPLLGSLQLFRGYISAIWSLGRAHGVSKPGASLCWRAVSGRGKTGRLPRPAGALLRPSVQRCSGADLCRQCTCSELHRPSWLHQSDLKSSLVLASVLQPEILNFLEIGQRKNIRQEAKQTAVLNCPLS